jgi:hypothetical protein
MQPLETTPPDRPDVQEVLCEMCHKYIAEYDFHNKYLCAICMDIEMNENCSIYFIENTNIENYSIETEN